MFISEYPQMAEMCCDRLANVLSNQLPLIRYIIKDFLHQLYLESRDCSTFVNTERESYEQITPTSCGQARVDNQIIRYEIIFVLLATKTFLLKCHLLVIPFLEQKINCQYFVSDYMGPKGTPMFPTKLTRSFSKLQV